MVEAALVVCNTKLTRGLCRTQNSYALTWAWPFFPGFVLAGCASSIFFVEVFRSDAASSIVYRKTAWTDSRKTRVITLNLASYTNLLAGRRLLWDGAYCCRVVSSQEQSYSNYTLRTSTYSNHPCYCCKTESNSGGHDKTKTLRPATCMKQNNSQHGN